jgi:hypothetical protein
MKKKLAAILTVSLTGFMLAGCQQKAEAPAPVETETVETEEAKEPESEPEPVVEPEPVSEPESETEEVVTETGEPKEMEVATGGYSAPDMGYRIDKHASDVADETDEEVLLLATEYDTITITKEGYDPLKESLALWNEENKKATEEAWDIDEIRKEYEENKEGWGSYGVYNTVEVTRFDEAVFSMKETSYIYSGGAHGDSGVFGNTYDSVSGQELKYEDICSDMGALKSYSAERIKSYVDKVYNSGEIPATFDGWEAEVDTFLNDPVWCFNDYGLEYVIGTYIIGPYAMGNVDVTVPYSELGGKVKDQYIKSGAAFTYQFGYGEEVVVDGSGNKLSAKKEDNEETYKSTVTLQFGEEAIIAAQDVDGVSDPWVVREEDGRVYVVLEVITYDDEVEYIHILYLLQDGGFRKIDEMKERAVTDAAEVEAIIEGMT